MKASHGKTEYTCMRLLRLTIRRCPATSTDPYCSVVVADRDETLVLNRLLPTMVLQVALFPLPVFPNTKMRNMSEVTEIISNHLAVK